jgi:uncharacterized protein (TIGR03435 family)
MRLPHFAHAAALLFFVGASASAQLPAVTSTINPDGPRPGSLAPPLTGAHLMHAAPGASLDWQSLHGKAVVLEFWATWCVPCVADIPVLNSLAASVDPAKVQFLSISDEDPAVVEAFLKTHAMSGLLVSDPASKLFDAFGVTARPATIIVGPDGRIASNSVGPESLRKDQLLALASGAPVVFAATGPGSADPAALAARTATIAREFTPPASPASPTNALFSLSVTPGEPGATDTHIMSFGPTRFDITNASPRELLIFAAHVPGTRITAPRDLPETRYNLHVDAPNADPLALAEAVKLAIISSAGIHIERHTATVSAFILTALPGASDSFKPSPFPGMANYTTKNGKIQAVNATPTELATALEKALGTPVIDETGITGKLTTTLSVAPNDLSSANAALAAEHLTLAPATRPVETFIFSAPGTDTSAK